MSVRIARKLETVARSAWSRPLVRTAVYGGAFAAGAVAIGYFFGPPVAERSGKAAGDGFARGMELARRELAGTLERGSRFG